MCDWDAPKRVLHRSQWPEWIQEYRNGDQMGVDPCLADTLLGLWARNVRTLGSCCGHGRIPPSLVLDGFEFQAQHARAVLNDIDPSRPWVLQQWRLIDVANADQVEAA